MTDQNKTKGKIEKNVFLVLALILSTVLLSQSILAVGYAPITIVGAINDLDVDNISIDSSNPQTSKLFYENNRQFYLLTLTVNDGFDQGNAVLLVHKNGQVIESHTLKDVKAWDVVEYNLGNNKQVQTLITETRPSTEVEEEELEEFTREISNLNTSYITKVRPDITEDYDFSPVRVARMKKHIASLESPSIITSTSKNKPKLSMPFYFALILFLLIVVLATLLIARRKPHHKIV